MSWRLARMSEVAQDFQAPRIKIPGRQDKFVPAHRTKIPGSRRDNGHFLSAHKNRECRSQEDIMCMFLDPKHTCNVTKFSGGEHLLRVRMPIRSKMSGATWRDSSDDMWSQWIKKNWWMESRDTGSGSMLKSATDSSITYIKWSLKLWTRKENQLCTENCSVSALLALIQLLCSAIYYHIPYRYCFIVTLDIVLSYIICIPIFLYCY